jgi:adenine-specific DNA-methyltransferase
MKRKPPLSNIAKEHARVLRQDATIPERLLWSKLRGGRLRGIKFRRQHPMSEFILDFYCQDRRLVIELDGDSHIEQARYDTERTAALLREGVQVLRIGNDDVLRDLDAVLQMILQACGQTNG